MNCTEKDVQLLQLAYYFISDCQYQFISLREAGESQASGISGHPAVANPSEHGVFR